MISEGLAHGFEKEEFEQRTLKAQRLMRLGEIDSLLLTTEPKFAFLRVSNAILAKPYKAMVSCGSFGRKTDCRNS